MARTQIDTGEIFYHMESAVSHLTEIEDRRDSLEMAIDSLISQWEAEFGETWQCA